MGSTSYARGPFAAPPGARAIVFLVPVNGAWRIDLRHREPGGGPLTAELQ
jgi:hypothetical protein